MVIRHVTVTYQSSHCLLVSRQQAQRAQRTTRPSPSPGRTHRVRLTGEYDSALFMRVYVDKDAKSALKSLQDTVRRKKSLRCVVTSSPMPHARVTNCPISKARSTRIAFRSNSRSASSTLNAKLRIPLPSYPVLKPTFLMPVKTSSSRCHSHQTSCAARDSTIPKGSISRMPQEPLQRS